MQNSKEKLKKALDNWAEINRGNAEIGIVEALFTGALVASPVIDRFSTWLLAGTGATAALMIANLDRIAGTIGVNGFRYAIIFLFASALLGFLAKYKSISCEIALAVERELKQRIIPVLTKHEEDEENIVNMADQHGLDVKTEINISFIIEEYCKAFPKIIHPWLKNQFALGIVDRLASGRRAAKNLFWQGNYTVLQFFCF